MDRDIWTNQKIGFNGIVSPTSWISFDDKSRSAFRIFLIYVLHDTIYLLCIDRMFTNYSRKFQYKNWKKYIYIFVRKAKNKDYSNETIDYHTLSLVRRRITSDSFLFPIADRLTSLDRAFGARSSRSFWMLATLLTFAFRLPRISARRHSNMDNIGNRDSRRWKKEGVGYFEGLPVERNSTMDLVKTLRRVLWDERILGKIIFVPWSWVHGRGMKKKCFDSSEKVRKNIQMIRIRLNYPFTISYKNH